MRESDARIVGVGPEERGANPFRESPDRWHHRGAHPGNWSAQIAQPPLEQHGEACQTEPEQTLTSAPAPTGRRRNAVYATAPVNRARAKMNQAMTSLRYDTDMTVEQ